MFRMMFLVYYTAHTGKNLTRLGGNYCCYLHEIVGSSEKFWNATMLYGINQKPEIIVVTAMMAFSLTVPSGYLRAASECTI
jgi:hypothetical protein